MMATEKEPPKRVVIYPTDIRKITGRSERGSRALLEKVRAFFGKEKNAMVTVEEFSIYSGIDQKTIYSFIT